jgi:copper chaperone CopZ
MAYLLVECSDKENAAELVYSAIKMLKGVELVDYAVDNSFILNKIKTIKRDLDRVINTIEED